MEYLFTKKMTPKSIYFPENYEFGVELKLV